jgi:catechol 2,3-dioxygenase-like lactoylglutathione lyase family enzyme
MKTITMSFIKESNITIMVNDMDKAVSFYESIGLTVKQRWDHDYAMMSAPGITIGLHPAEETNTNSGTVSIGFMIDKTEDAKTLLDKNKIAYSSHDDGKSGSYIHFKDPYGTVLYFVKPKW